MDIRKEMWDRAKYRVYNDCLIDACNGKYKYDYELKMIQEYKLIYGGFCGKSRCY